MRPLAPQPARHQPARLAAIACGLALLWLPTPWHGWVKMHWMFLGLLLALWAGLVCLKELKGGARPGPTTMTGLLFAAYLLHQFEAHGFDLRGMRFGWMDAFNQGPGGWLPCNGEIMCPTDPQSILMVQTGIVWTTFLLAMTFRGSRPSGIAATGGLVIVTALLELACGALGGYHAGLATAVVLLGPLGYLWWRRVKESGFPADGELAIGIAWAAATPVFILAAGLPTLIWGAVPEWVFDLFCVAWAVVPFGRWQVPVGLSMTGDALPGDEALGT